RFMECFYLFKSPGRLSGISYPVKTSKRFIRRTERQGSGYLNRRGERTHKGIGDIRDIRLWLLPCAGSPVAAVFLNGALEISKGQNIKYSDRKKAVIIARRTDVSEGTRFFHAL
ncbi:hypothetical protein, partial [[Clostridium] scindens]